MYTKFQFSKIKFSFFFWGCGLFFFWFFVRYNARLLPLDIYFRVDVRLLFHIVSKAIISIESSILAGCYIFIVLYYVTKGRNGSLHNKWYYWNIYIIVCWLGHCHLTKTWRSWLRVFDVLKSVCEWMDVCVKGVIIYSLLLTPTYISTRLFDRYQCIVYLMIYGYQFNQLYTSIQIKKTTKVNKIR